MAKREVRVAILGDSRDFSRAVRDVTSGSTKMERALNGAKRMAFGLGAAFAAREVVQFGSTLIKAAEESQKVTKQTAAVIKSMGDAANTSAQQVAKLSTKLSLKSGIDDELIQSGSNVLLTFGKIRNEVGKGNKIFDRATQAALDMSVALKMDMKSASILVGKALNDPIKGLTSLTRAGIQFTDSQKEQIKSMVAVGDTAGAQKVILDELGRQFGGSAEAQATASDKLKVAWGNIQEQLGAKLLPVVERFSTWLAEKLPGAMAKAEEMGAGFIDWLKRNETLVKGIGVAAGVMGVALVTAWAVNTAAAAAASIKQAVSVGIMAAHWVGLAGTAQVSSASIAASWFRVLGPMALVVAAAEKINRLVGQQTPNKSPLQGGSWNPFKGMSIGIPGFADGGVMPGPRGKHSLAWVAGGETILPTHKSVGGGGGMNITINMPPGSDGRDVVEKIRQYERSNGTSWRN